jgi:hypothetical protein
MPANVAVWKINWLTHTLRSFPYGTRPECQVIV